MIVVGCEEAPKQRVIADFVRAVEKHCPSGIMTPKLLHSDAFFPFWPNCFVTRYLEEEDDFLFVLFGTALVEGHDRDLTGHRLSEAGFTKTEQAVRETNLKVLESGKPIFASGQVDQMNREYRKWHNVKFPYDSGNGHPETLGCVVFGY